MTETNQQRVAAAWGFHGRGDKENSQKLCEEVLADDPNNPGALHLSGVLAFERSDMAQAAEFFSKAVTQYGDEPSWFGHLAHALMEVGNFDQAVERLEQGLALAPGDGGLCNAMGLILKRTGTSESALPWFQKAVKANANDASFLNNLGNALTQIGRQGDGEVFLRRVTELAPTWADGFNNLSFCLFDQGCPAESLAACEQALSLAPEHVEAHINRGNALLALGRYAEGWEDYEWRWKRANCKPRSFKQSLWQGEDLGGKTILLHAEQGIGDVLMSVRFATLVKALGARVVMEMPKVLAPLLAGLAGCDEIVVEGQELPTFDVHCPLLSLPRLLGLEVATIPATGPYIKAEPGRVSIWRDKVPDTGLKVGLAWQGNPSYARDALRSLFPEDMAPFEGLEGVTFVSLLKGGGDTQALPFPVMNFGDELDRDKPFLDTIALMESLDLVIAVDTSLAHLAGAAGRPVWLALTKGCDWRWMQGRADSPWYPATRLFRQTKPGDWSSVVTEMAEELARMA